MDNGERGRRLMTMAAEYLQDMDAATGRTSWNAVFRRAQEVVELALKGVPSYLGVDFPKVHDPAAVFIATLSTRGMALSVTEAEDANVSATLARKRAPAFYFEQIEDEATAEAAAADAHRIHGICMRLVAAIESELPEPNERPAEQPSAEGEPGEPRRASRRLTRNMTNVTASSLEATLLPAAALGYSVTGRVPRPRPARAGTRA